MSLSKLTKVHLASWSPFGNQLVLMGLSRGSAIGRARGTWAQEVVFLRTPNGPTAH